MSSNALHAALRRRAFDVTLGALALLIGTITLTLPFGRDQGLYHYVGREWFLHGQLPYRDLFEQKTPGIFIVHGVSNVLFCDVSWGIRVWELLLVLGFGAVVAWGGCDRRERPAHGSVGLSMLAAVLLYGGFFNYWPALGR